MVSQKAFFEYASIFHILMLMISSKLQQILLCLEKVVSRLNKDDQFGLIFFSGKEPEKIPLTLMTPQNKVCISLFLLLTVLNLSF